MTAVAAAPAAVMLAPDKNRRRPASTNRSHRLLIAVLPCLRGAPLRFFPKQLYPYCRIRGEIATPLTAKVAPVAATGPSIGPKPAFRPSGKLPEQTFRHVSSQFFPRDIGERATVLADHQPALTAPVEAIAGNMGTVVLEESAASAIPLASKGRAKCKDGLRQLCPGFIVL